MFSLAIYSHLHSVFLLEKGIEWDLFCVGLVDDDEFVFMVGQIGVDSCPVPPFLH